MKQTTLGSTDWALKTKVTRRAKFLAEMEAVIPWPRLHAVIEPHFPKAEQGRPPCPLPRMLRIYFMQQWFNLSDPAMEDALYDSESMRRFATPWPRRAQVKVCIESSTSSAPARNPGRTPRPTR